MYKGGSKGCAQEDPACKFHNLSFLPGERERWDTTHMYDRGVSQMN